VQFKIAEDIYETIVTNLDRGEFRTEELKRMYNLKWGIEVSFRELKYTVCLNARFMQKNESIKHLLL